MSMSTLSFISSNHPDLSPNQSNGPNQREKLTKQIVINVNIDSNPINIFKIQCMKNYYAHSTIFHVESF